MKYTAARRAVKAVIFCLKRALMRGETVELPWGQLVVEPTRQRRKLCFGKIVDVPGHRWTVSLKLKRAPRHRPARKDLPETAAPAKKPRAHSPVQVSVPTYQEKSEVPSRTRKLGGPWQTVNRPVSVPSRTRKLDPRKR